MIAPRRAHSGAARASALFKFVYALFPLGDPGFLVFRVMFRRFAGGTNLNGGPHTCRLILRWAVSVSFSRPNP